MRRMSILMITMMLTAGLFGCGRVVAEQTVQEAAQKGGYYDGRF